LAPVYPQSTSVALKLAACVDGKLAPVGIIVSIRPTDA
jgi:hypothetical protein